MQIQSRHHFVCPHLQGETDTLKDSRHIPDGCLRHPAKALTHLSHQALDKTRHLINAHIVIATPLKSGGSNLISSKTERDCRACAP
jgi:hypothetical protein